MPASLKLDPSHSTLEIRTQAEGALSRLAHNLVIGATQISGSATPGEPASADVRVFVAGLRVRGVLKGEAVDLTSPSRGDRDEIERRIRTDVLSGEAVDVHLDVTGGVAQARLRWVGGSASLQFPVQLEPRSDGGYASTGEAPVSLKLLGVKPIVGPLRAFRVVDTIRVRWEAVFIPHDAPGSA